MTRPIELRLPPLPEYVSIARLCLAGIGARLSLPLETIEELKVALAEACTNVVQHAYGPSDEDKDIRILFAFNEDSLTMIVEDTGRGFDPSKDLQPPTPEKDRGLGLFLIKALVDEVTIDSAPGKGTRIKMKKALHEKTEPASSA